MKKKVRIYKSGGDTGAYINKTAQWMMQTGGTPDVSQLGYPSQAQTQEMTQDQLINSITTDLSNQVPEQQIAFKLVNIHGIDPVSAKQYVEQVKGLLVNQNEEDEEVIAEEQNNTEEELEYQDIPEEEFETEEEAELVNEDTYEDVDDNEFAADLIMKFGGSKRNYVKSALKLIKKKQGGDSKTDDADPIGENVRKNITGNFVNTIKNEAVLAKAKEQAEKEYEQLQAMQNNYAQQSALQNFIPEEQDYMQFGGQRRAMRQFNRAMRKMPFGMTGPVTKFDVKRSGLFGRPKEYSMEFGMNPLMQLANPMLAGMYGYGRVANGTKSQGRIVTETNSKANNKKSTKEVASQNNSEAANKSAQPTLEEMRAAATAAGDWGYTPPQTNTGSPQSSVENENDVVVKPSVKKDKWGRPEGDKWYGFDPVKKKYEKPGAQVEPNMEAIINRNKNSKQVNQSVFQSGGMVNDPMSDPYGNLQRFISGGNDIDQADIDDVYSKDTTDPYFKYGGLTEYQGDEEGSETDENTNKGFYSKSLLDDYKKRVGDANNMSLRDDIPYSDVFKMGEKSDINFGNNNEDTDYETRLAEEKKKWEQEFMQRQNPFGSTPNMMGNFGKKIMEGYGYNPLINNRALPGMPQYMGSWDKTIRAPYDKRTGQQFAGMQGFNPNAQISNIDVTKTGILGRPKKYSITYNNNPSGRPEDRRLAGSAPSITTPKGTTDTKDLGAGASGDIRRGERKTARQVARGEKQFPETTDTTPRLGNLEYMQQAKNRNWSYQDTPKVGAQYYGPGLNANQVEKREPVNNTSAWVTDPSKAFMGKNQYGGLHKFLPQAEPGAETPVTQDERFETMPIVSSKQAGQSLYDQSKQKVMDQGSYEPDEYTKDYKRKDMFAGDLGEALPMINAGLRGGTGMLNRYRDKDREAAMYENLTADNLYAVDPSRDRGDYETNTGLYRPDEQGQIWNSRSAQLGGAMEDYYEDEEVDMTEEELEDFLANGGEVEYL
jgi:hypothetical protein